MEFLCSFFFPKKEDGFREIYLFNYFPLISLKCFLNPVGVIAGSGLEY